MARSMRLFLIRHGETVDNIAQLYAGSRDSALTNHGYQQATRLGLHFKALGLTFTHIFSSHLQRAAKTAGLIREAQQPPKSNVDSAATIPRVTQLRVLMEQDFGHLEGKKWTDVQAGIEPKPGYVAVESKEALSHRADAFVDEHILPLLNTLCDDGHYVVAIVSHGIFLSTLWKRLLRRLPKKSITLSRDLQSTARPSLEHLGGWSNTGYLDLHLTLDKTRSDPPCADATPTLSSKRDSSQNLESEPDDVATQAVAGGAEASVHDTLKFCNATPALFAPSVPTTSGPRIAQGWKTKILTINGKDHLKGLKRTGGGVGSSRHDASQTGIESFFKRRRVN